jgi:hypothetical protein
LRKSVQRCGADPFKHAAVVCYPVADALDADPFALLLLRGRPRDEVLAALRARRCSGDMEGTPRIRSGRRSTRGRAGEASGACWPRCARRRCRRSDPAGPPCCSSTRHPALAADAVARLGAATGDGGLSLNLEADLARRAAGLLGAGVG